MQLQGSSVVVTGSSSGIGASVALRFAEEGANVVVTSKSNADGGREVAERIAQLGRRVIYVQADLSSPSGVDVLFDRAEGEFGSVDILVNNAGRTEALPFLETDDAHWLEALRTNLMTTVSCSRRVVPGMRAKGRGAIVNTASVRGIDHCGREGIMAYSAAKAAVINFTRTLAKDLAPVISVCAVAPGIVHTPYLDSVDEVQKQRWLSAIPIGRFIEPSELAEAYLFLARAEFMTGAVLAADGGFTLKQA